MIIRPMVDADVEGATRAQVAAFAALYPDDAALTAPPSEDMLARMHRRYRHFMAHDPAGAWTAVEDGRVVGTALALRRGDLWGLSLLVVDPSAQSSGIGRQLLDASLTYAEGCPRAFILSTHDPRAMRLYATSGFDVYPQLDAEGPIDVAALPVGSDRVRDGGPADIDFADAVDLDVRGATHGPDQRWLAEDLTMYVVDDADGRGYAYVRGDSLIMTLAATDEDTASALLWRCLARISAAGKPASIYHLNAEQQWAIRIAYRARLVVTPAGPAYWRGGMPPRCYLPSGAFL